MILWHLGLGGPIQFAGGKYVYSWQSVIKSVSGYWRGFFFFFFYRFCEFHVQKCIVSKPELLITIWESVCVPVISKIS